MLRKRILAFVLCLCLMAGAAPVFAPTAKAAGNGVAQKIESLKSKYPHGWYWNHRVDTWSALGDNLLNSGDETYQNSVTRTACATHSGSPAVGQGKYDCNYFDGGIQCWGFANKLFNEIFGIRRSSLPRRTDRENIMVGDYVRFGTDDNGHSVLVTGRNGNTITIVECNFGYEAGDRCQIKWGRQQNLYADMYGLPFSYFCHASNYDDVNGPIPPPTPIYPTDAVTFTGGDFLGRIYYPAGDKYLENRGGNVQIANYDSSDPRQIWFFKREGSAYIMQSLYDGRYFDSATGQGSGANVGVWEENGDPAQRWIFYRDAGGQSNCYNIASSFDTSLVVDVDNASTHAGANVQAWTRNATGAQAFQVLTASDAGRKISRDIGTDFYAQISYNDTYLQTTGTVKDQGMDVRTTRASRPNDPKQIWFFTRNGNGSYKIKNMYSGWCLDVQTGVAENGKNVWTWHDDHGESPEQWYLVNSPGESKYRFVSALEYPESRFCLDVYQGRTDENTDVTIWSQNEMAHQQFTITKVSYSTATPSPKPTATPSPTPSTEIIFAQSKLYLTAGNTLELAALDTSAKPYPGQLEWRSDNTGVAAVDSSGKVTGIKDGSAVISASAGRYTASCTVIVGPWYQSAVDFALEKGLMNGYSDGSFGANDRLGRAQLAQILYNKEDRPAVTVTGKFSDIGEDAWYSKAVSWAAERKIVNGYDDGRFGHSDPITRQDLAVMLWRYAGSPDSGGSVTGFSDADKISGYAENALRWAVENGIMNGSGGKLNPLGYATRAEAAQMLKNYIQPKMQRG